MENGDAFDRLRAALADRYRIERVLGEGGMATVYLADDLRHGRKVALKVLKSELAAFVGADRFLAEVSTTASLQHPHILPLFDSGQADGFLFYVTPYVRGESLRDRLAQNGPLPVDDAVSIASHVAEALDYAHRSGVIHRDIKPANVLLQDGQPVVSDFGISLAVGAGAGPRLTETGLALGTPHYMSPEQATGDQRIGPTADVYALGCVLYEMLAGEPPYTGPTPQAILGKVVLGKLTPIRQHRPTAPTHVVAVVARALERVPADRFQTGGELARALKDPGFRWPRDAVVARSSNRTLAVIGGAGALMLASLFLVQSFQRSDAPRDAVPRTALSFQLPEGQLLAIGNPSSLELSPDGRRLAYVGEQGTSRRVYIRDFASFDVRPVTGTEGASSLFFSPDGEQIGFYAHGALRRIAIAGGIASAIADVPSAPIGVSWGDDGTILYGLAKTNTLSLWRVSAAGGTPHEIPLVIDTSFARDRVELPTPTKQNVLWPYHLPRADLALVSLAYPPSVGVIELKTGRFRPLFEGNRAYYLPTGHIVFYSGPEQVSVVPFDLDRRELTGPAVPVVDDVLRPAGSEGRFTVSRNGTLAYARGGFARRLELVDRFGRATPLAVRPRGYRLPAVSPDGRFLAVTVDPQPPEIWIIDIRAQRAHPVSTGGYHISPVWLRDGTRLAFHTNPGIAWIPWPEGGTPTKVALPQEGGVSDWPVADRMLAELLGDVLLLDVATGSLTSWLKTPASEEQARVSPDGGWVAYVSNVSGAEEIYVRRYSGAPPDIPVSNGGGTEPAWSADGSKIFYRNGNAILSVSVRTKPRFEVSGSPEVLFSGDYDFSNPRNWDVMPDGRLVMIRSSPGVRREIRILSGWLK